MIWAPDIDKHLANSALSSNPILAAQDYKTLFLKWNYTVCEHHKRKALIFIFNF